MHTSAFKPYFSQVYLATDYSLLKYCQTLGSIDKNVDCLKKETQQSLFSF